MQDRIDAALVAAFSPKHFVVEDESHFHHRGEQTHYKVIIVSDLFDGVSRVKRHQQVYAALGDIMQQIHSLAIHAYTMSEWQREGLSTVPESPLCQGGSLHDMNK